MWWQVIYLSVSKLTARSYLESIDPFLRELAEECAEAFIEAREARDVPHGDTGK